MPGLKWTTPTNKARFQVKWFNVKKGWGFIIGENGEDIFVHQSGVNKAGFRSLDDGEMVEYEIRNTDKGPEACKITGPQGKLPTYMLYTTYTVRPLFIVPLFTAPLL